MQPLSPGLLAEINLWAVAVAALATFLLGGLWYSPALFEGAWVDAHGYDAAEVEAMQASLGPPRFAAALASYLAMAFVFALLIVALGVDRVTGGLALGALVWLGFVAATGLTVTLFSPRPLATWIIDAGFQLTFLLMAGALLALWR